MVLFSLSERYLFLYSIIQAGKTYRIVIKNIVLTLYHFNTVSAMIYLSVQNTIVVEGGSAIFECGYSGPGMITWRVNDIDFTPPERPVKHSLSLSDDRIMTLRGADLNMNGSRYQCTAESMISSAVYLFVLPGT